ncbi:hypothetical protein ATANTOWER_018301 [Ataeniobius toweri]|uniref:Secreted protein n=1 Tax=Ataeniobius toweri TaxID=208326 RepID=A0ABU7B0T3_9TELE|nr:hypothetical protein [Ataeniobius toweri]
MMDGWRAGGRMYVRVYVFVLFCTIINRLASRCRCKVPFSSVLLVPLFLIGSEFFFYPPTGPSLVTLFFVVPDGLGSPWTLFTPPAGRLRELMWTIHFLVLPDSPPITKETTLYKLSAPATKGSCDLV